MAAVENIVQHDYTIFETRNGFAAVAWSENGVSRLRLPAVPRRAPKRPSCDDFRRLDAAHLRRW